MEGRAENGSGVKTIRAANARLPAVDDRSLSGVQHTQGKKALHRIPTIGPHLSAAIPTGPISHAPRLNCTDEELKQLKILSALDMLLPVYDQPQQMGDVKNSFDEAGLLEVQLRRGYNGINAKGKRPN